MPLNYVDLQPQLKEFIRLNRILRSELATKLQTALKWLKNCGSNHERKKEHIRSLSERIQPIPRCGIPSIERADAVFQPPKDIPEFQMIASDGSQITPSRHDSVPVALINSSRIHYRPGSGSAPQVQVFSQLLARDNNSQTSAEISEELISLKRDVQELRVLADWDSPTSGHKITVALQDGPLELFHEPRRIPDFDRDFQQYLLLMDRLYKKKTILAGYTDKPRAALVIRMLEIAAEIDNEKIDLSGLSDLTLYSTLLEPGQRSAVFSLYSPSSGNYTGPLALFFFYLNVGSEKKPSIARVEIPQWTAADTGSTGLLHHALLMQCRLLGSRPYPYILHRAHEEALVSQEEKQKLIEKLSIMLQREGLGIYTSSNKQAAKDLEGRRRL